MMGNDALLKRSRYKHEKKTPGSLQIDFEETLTRRQATRTLSIL